jgi:hypothetical protein
MVQTKQKVLHFFPTCQSSYLLGNKLFPLASEYNINGTPRTTVFDQKQYGFSLGGALVKDKLHYFVAYDRQTETIPYQIAPVYNQTQEQNFGITKENLDKLIEVARAKYGMKNTQQYGDFPDKQKLMHFLFVWIGRLMIKTNLLSVITLLLG